MACMCGDTCCPSCGPAQGHYRCLIHNTFDCEWCYDEDGSPIYDADEFAAAEARDVAYSDYMEALSMAGSDE